MTRTKKSRDGKPINREHMLFQVRKLVQKIGVNKRVWRMHLDEVRRHAHTLLVDRQDWLIPREKAMLTAFILEDDGYQEFICHGCDKVCSVKTCNNARCEACCEQLCGEDQ